MEAQTTTKSCCEKTEEVYYVTNPHNTLRFSSAHCINCGMCLMVCPHAVFGEGEKTVILQNPADCIECGACQMNCPTRAIQVDSGVGCAAAMINAVLKGSSEVTCGCDTDSCC